MVDFLATKVLQSAISTNFDCLIEKAAESLGRCHFIGSLTPTEYSGGSDPFNQLFKLHGCCIRQQRNTLWCAEQIGYNSILKDQITNFQSWLRTYLNNKDLLITGFWSDWEYINNILFSSLIGSQPSSVILVDPSTASSLMAKAPDLWSWANSGSIWFRHITESGSNFLNELRILKSRILFRNLFNDSLPEYRNKYGIEYSGPTELDHSLSSDDLYSLRRNLEGLLSNEVIRKIEHRNEQKRFAITHLRILNLGGSLTGSQYLHNSKTIRLIHAAGELMSSIKSKYIKEPPIHHTADITICAGASQDASPSSIVRGTSTPTIVRPGLVGDWLTDEEYFSKYCTVTP